MGSVGQGLYYGAGHETVTETGFFDLHEPPFTVEQARSDPLAG